MTLHPMEKVIVGDHYRFYIGRFSEAGSLEQNALCNLSHKMSREVAAHFRADFWVGVASRCV